MRSLFIVMAGAILLGGCAAAQPMHWTKPGATQEAFMRDHLACVQETQLDPWSFYKGGHASLVHGSAGVQRRRQRQLVPAARASRDKQLDRPLVMPNPAAVSAASEDYKRAVADYRNCLAANPKNVNACEGQRHIMDADAQVLGGSPQGSR